MRIVIDMQGAQTESRYRGIGRYTMAFAQGVVRNRGNHEVILLLSGLFPETIKPIRAAFDGLLPMDNIIVWHAPGPVREEDPGNDTRRDVAELIREAFIASLRPDVIHICSLFEGYVDDAITSIERYDTTTPVSVSFYDLIPLLNPDKYLKPNPVYAVYYERKIQSLKRAKSFLAISAYIRLEGLDCLGVDASRMVNVSSAIGPEFQPVVVNEEVARILRDKIGLSRPFVLYTGACDERKNLPRLIEAWSALPPSLRQTHQLVFVGKIPEGNLRELSRIAQAHGLQPTELCFSGYISDEELIFLYNLCELYVLPSWHEGFGLPALEAMACGAPVIAANATSLPEVVGLDEALFDPFDSKAIASKMAQALLDERFRNRLCEHGLKQSKKFSWDATAKRAIAAWQALLTHGEEPSQDSWKKIQVFLTDEYRRLIDGIAQRLPLQVDNSELGKIAICLDWNEQQIVGFIRPTKLPEQLTWRIEGPFDSSYSLALVNREVARALTSLGHIIVLHSTDGPGDFLPDETFLADNPDLAKMNHRASQVSQWDANVTSRNLYPPRVSDMVSRFNFLHAYGWEESGFPLDWVDAFNISLQGMTVMSDHVRKIMINHGVTVPIAVCSIGVDHWLRIRSDNNFHHRGGSFRFLHVSSCFPRKGPDVLIRAYGQAFRSGEDVTLIIKTFDNPHNEIHRWLDNARLQDQKFPHVEIITEDLTDAQLKALYEQCHVLVAPSRGEGFGLPMAEAMLSGLAVITTGWGGQTDFCTPDTAWLVDYRFEFAQTHFGLFDSVWAEPDVAHLAALMREVYELPHEARAVRTYTGRKLLLERFLWSQTAQRMVDAVRGWTQMRQRLIEPCIGWVTTWGTRCGIAGYSAHLVSQMSRQVEILAAHATDVSEEMATSIRRCWTAGDQDPLLDLRKAINEKKIDILVIQFNYGFFDFAVLSDFITEQANAGRIIVVMMHATQDPEGKPTKKLASLVSAFSRCHRLIVHTPADLNRLKALGLVANVALLPHGIPDWPLPSKKAEHEECDWQFASYGFFLPHKGLLQLVEAIALLRERGWRGHLRMVNAEYPIFESRQSILQVQEKIRSLGLKDNITLHTDFMSDSDCLRLLTSVDLILFPYQDTAESSSAAVRYGIAAGPPVVVTPLPIFADVEHAVHKLPGISPQDIAAGINTLLKWLLEKNPTMAAKAAAAETWRVEHRWPRVAARFEGMLEGLFAERGDCA